MQNVYPFPVSTVDSVMAFLYDNYILSARQRGDEQVSVHVLDVWRALSEKHSEDFIRAVLGSKKFRDTYNLSLVGASPGQNEYIFGLQSDAGVHPHPARVLPFKRRAA